MERTLSNFIRALRNAEVRVSTAETLDAFNAMELVGYRDRAFLKDALSMVLPKTADEKESFSECFDSFFSFKTVEVPWKEATVTSSTVRPQVANAPLMGEISGWLRQK